MEVKVKSKGTRKPQSIKLPLPIRRKLERIAKSKYLTMNDAIVMLIEDAPEPPAKISAKVALSE